jgi:predicted dehydrogenase
MKRRHFVKNLSFTAAGLAVLPASFAGTAHATKVRLGIIGVGLRGQNHLENMLRRSDVEVVSICDLNPRMLADSKALIQKSGKIQPKVYTGDAHAYRSLLAAKNIDGVLIATPWEWHTPMILDALSAGVKYIGTEVMLGITLEDHWQVVQAAEAANAHVMMLENVCYRRDVMAVLNAVRQGMFGEIMHLQGGYQHDLRGVKFNDGKTPYNSGVEFGEKGFSEAACILRMALGHWPR